MQEETKKENNIKMPAAISVDVLEELLPPKQFESLVREYYLRQLDRSCYVTVGDVTRKAEDWDLEMGYNRGTVRKRVTYLGWPPAKAVLTTPRTYKNKPRYYTCKFSPNIVLDLQL